MRWAIFLTLALAAQNPERAAPPSTLPMRLVGVVVDNASPARSACLVRCTYPEEKTARFQAGDRACDLAEIRQIRTDGVLIGNLLTDREETLAFAEERLSAPGASAPAAPVVTASGDAVTVAVSPDSVNYYLGNLSDLLDSALATPRLLQRPDGTHSMEGYEISQVRKGGLADQVGLQNGDILLDVNGRRLDGLATVIALFGQVSSTSEARITVLRKGRRLTILLNTKGNRR